jgi:PAS domain S-box-containing protein
VGDSNPAMKKHKHRRRTDETAALRATINKLRAELREAQETLRAIRSGEVDALVVEGPQGTQVFSLTSAEQPYRLLVEQMQEGAATAAMDGTVLYCNRRLAAMLQMPMEKLVGAPVQNLVTPSEQPGLATMLNSVRMGMFKFARAETTLQAGNRVLMPVNLSVNVIEINAAPVLCFVFTDLTERKRAEEALQRSHDELEERVRERTAELSEANEKLGVANEELEATGEELRQQNDELLAAQQALEAERQRYRDLFDLAPIGYLVTDPQGTILKANHAAAALFGASEEGLTGTSLTMFAVDPHEDGLCADLDKLRPGEAPRLWETVVRTFDGTAVPVVVSVSLVVDSAGGPATPRWTLRDISERKRAETELTHARAEAERRARELEILMDAVPAGVMITRDPQGRQIFGNRATHELLRVASEESNISKSAPDPHRVRSYRPLRDGVEIPPEELPIQRAARGEEVRDWGCDLVFDDGEVRHVIVNATPLRDEDGAPRGAIGALMDLTARREAEARLAADLAALTRMHALSGRLVAPGGLQPLLQEVMDAAVAIMGAEQGTLQLLDGRSLRIVAHRGHQQPFLDFFASAENVASVCGEATMRGERVVVPDVEKSPLFAETPSLAVLREAGVRAVQSTPLMSRTGALLGILTTHWGVPYSPDEHDLWRLDLLARQAADLIEYAKADEALRLAYSRLKTLFDREIDGIGVLVANAEGAVLEANDFYLGILGYSRQDLEAGKVRWRDATPPEWLPADERALAELRERGKAAPYEKEYVRPDGTRVPVLLIDTVFPGQGGEILAFCLDLSIRKRGEQALRESEERFRIIASSTPDHLLAQDRDLRYTLVINPQLGLTAEDMIGKTDHQILANEDADRLTAIKRKVLETGEPVHLESSLVSSTGERGFFEGAYVPRLDAQGRVDGLIGYFKNITERKRAEEELHRLNRTLRALSRSNQTFMHARVESEYLDEVCRIIVEDCGYAMVWIGYAEQGEARTVRPVASAGLDEGYLETLRITWADTERGRGPTGTAIRTGKPCGCSNMQTDPRFAPWREEAVKRGYGSSMAIPLLADGNAFGALTIYSREPDPFSEAELRLLAELADDVANGITTIRARLASEWAKESLRQSEERFRTLANATFEGVAVTEAGRYVDANEQLLRILGYDRDELIGMEVAATIIPEDRERVSANICDGRESVTEHQIVRKDGSRRTVEAHGRTIRYQNREIRFTAIRDITERKQAEEALRCAVDDLARSNQDLERFAYVASHDLQEPLRMVTGYMALLKRRYQGQLDSKADEFIDFAVDGASRMSQLIKDLLAYSRAGARDKGARPTDCNHVIRDVLTVLRSSIEENDAAVTHDVLPTVRSNATQLAQLFQNLIGNAIKFRGQEPPRIHLAARPTDEGWQFSISDNGIGIAPEFSEQVFEVFRRLHGRDKYPGTGIGLAICKRIVEHLGGRIWVESEIGKGSTFHFTLPGDRPATTTASAV